MIILATLALSITERGRLNDLVGNRNLALVQQAERLQAMPWDDLMLISSGTTQMLIGDFVFNRRLTVTMATATRRRVTVTILPVTSEFVPDSVTIERTRPASGTPLCTTC